MPGGLRADRRGRIEGLLLVAIGIAGAAIAAYLTTVHYAQAPLVCSSSGLVNCEKVLDSSYATVLGVPWSVGGIGWFVVTGALGLLTLRTAEPAWLQPAQLAWSLLGLLTVFYLVGVEAVGLGVLCAWCTVLHVLIVLTLAITLLRRPAAPVERAPDRRAAGGVRSRP